MIFSNLMNDQPLRSQVTASSSVGLSPRLPQCHQCKKPVAPPGLSCPNCQAQYCADHALR
jgi:hypothetical protein